MSDLRHNRERLIDTMDEIFAEEFIADGSETERVLAALEAAGYAWYRPDDCELGQIDGATFADNPDGMDGLIVLVPSREHRATRQKVRLVPVESGPT